MSWNDYVHIVPRPHTVHAKEQPCGRPFGFAQHSGISWKPEGAERRTRSPETVEWAKTIREKGGHDE